MINEFTQTQLIQLVRKAYELAHRIERDGREEIEYAQTLSAAVKVATMRPDLAEGRRYTHNLGRKQYAWFEALLGRD